MSSGYSRVRARVRMEARLRSSRERTFMTILLLIYHYFILIIDKIA